MAQNSFTGANVDELRADLKPIFKEFHEKTGIYLEMGNMTYDSTEVRFKVTANKVTIGSDPELEKHRISLKKYGHLFGVTEKDFMLPMVNNKGEKMLLLGVNPKKSKHPLIVKFKDKVYNYTEGPLKTHLAKKKVA